LFFKLSIKQIEIQNSKFRSLSEATPYHHNVFTFTLFLLEGRAGVAWEPSNKIMLFLSSSLLLLGFKGLNADNPASVDSSMESRTQGLREILAL
jgi:hypothetical protein